MVVHLWFNTLVCLHVHARVLCAPGRASLVCLLHCAAPRTHTQGWITSTSPSDSWCGVGCAQVLQPHHQCFQMTCHFVVTEFYSRCSGVYVCGWRHSHPPFVRCHPRVGKLSISRLCDLGIMIICLNDVSSSFLLPIETVWVL